MNSFWEPSRNDYLLCLVGDVHYIDMEEMMVNALRRLPTWELSGNGIIIFTLGRLYK